MNDRVTDILVVAPARNEAGLLPRCLSALTAAADNLAVSRPSLACHITVVLDSCTDASAAVVARHHGIAAFPTSAGNVGAARRQAVSWAAASYANDVPPEHVWVAMTDADTEVPDHWLTQQIVLAEQGHDLLLGTVEPKESDLTVEDYQRWWRDYDLRDGHGHVHGANLGFRLSTYLAAGGFTDVSVHEDVALVAGIRAAGGRVRATASLHAVTGGRLTGRTPDGFAGYLSQL